MSKQIGHPGGTFSSDNDVTTEVVDIKVKPVSPLDTPLAINHLEYQNPDKSSILFKTNENTIE